MLLNLYLHCIAGQLGNLKHFPRYLPSIVRRQYFSIVFPEKSADTTLGIRRYFMASIALYLRVLFPTAKRFSNQND